MFDCGAHNQSQVSLRTLTLAIAGAAMWLGCGGSTPAAVPRGGSSPCRGQIEDVSWLTGHWYGQTPQGSIEEHWTPAVGGTMLATGRLVSGEKTAFFEYLRIEARSSGLVYIAHPLAAPGTEFKLTRCALGEAMFENPEHDNPKRIHYRKTADGALHVRVEGDEQGKPVSEDLTLEAR
jgi:hypothetical protein